MGAAAVVVSQVVIVASWSDARYGTVANAVLLAGAALGYLSRGPSNFRAAYEREVAQGLFGPVLPRRRHRVAVRGVKRHAEVPVSRH